MSVALTTTHENGIFRGGSLPFLRHYPTSGQHYIDYALPQVYNAFVIIVPCEHCYWAWGKTPEKPLQYGLIRAK